MNESPIATAGPAHLLAAGWDCHVHVFDAAAPVRAGHYRPSHRPLAEIEAMATRHGVGHLLLVQPSVYGTDNTVLLQALRFTPGRHRGVVVVDSLIGDAELLALHEAGVRGVRFNLVSPVGHTADPHAELRALAPRLRELGWFVQWYVSAPRLPQLAQLQRETGLTFVLDHLAGLHADLPEHSTAWQAVRRLAESGSWVKLSGWYRLGAVAPYAALHATASALAEHFGPRCLWGSDWPHTSFAADALPPYAELLAPVLAALGARRMRSLLDEQPLGLLQ